MDVELSTFLTSSLPTTSRKFQERCTAFLVVADLVMAVCAPDCKKDLDVYETFIKNVTKILWEGRLAGAKDFYITGDFNVELGLLCTDEDDSDEPNEMYGPLCWQSCDNDHKKLMWYEIMKEFSCKLSPTWSRDGRDKELAFTHDTRFSSFCGFVSCVFCISSRLVYTARTISTATKW